MNSIASGWNQHWLDRMYNNRLRVPDHATNLMRWGKDSESVRDQLPCQLDQAYGSQPGETLDIFPASAIVSDRNAPVLVFIHGGYWRALDKADHSFIAPAFTPVGACIVVPKMPCRSQACMTWCRFAKRLF